MYHVSEVRNAYRMFLLKLKWKTQLGRQRRMWEDNIKMGLNGTGWKVVDWIHVAQGRDRWWALVNTVMNLRVP
jgi:hypothetical protein